MEEDVTEETILSKFIKVAKYREVKEISKGVEIPNKEEDVTEETIFEGEEEENYDTKEDPITGVIGDSGKYQLLMCLLIAFFEVD